MDIAIDPDILKTRQRRVLLRSGLVLALFVLLLLLLRQWLSPSVNRAQIRTAVVEQGAVSTELVAAGIVVPMQERVLTSPLSSGISEVYLALGSQVQPGDAILKLDDEVITREITRLRDELRLRDLEIGGLRQQQKRELQALYNQKMLADLDMQNFRVVLGRYESLQATGVVAEFDLDAAKLNARKAELQALHLQQQLEDTQHMNLNGIEQRELARQLLAQQLAEQERLLEASTVRARDAGSLTVLASELGSTAVAGSELARISDLSSYRVDATLSDYFLHEVTPDMAVRIDLGATELSGHISRILPAVDNGTIRLQIALDEPGHVQLKPNLRMEVRIVTASRKQGLRVANGVVFNGSGVQQIFVVQGTKAVQRSVEVGLQNSRYVEIMSGLVAGEEIIISDMGDYRHLQEVTVTD